MARVLVRQGFVGPINVLLDMGLLDADDLALWRRGGDPVSGAGAAMQSDASQWNSVNSTIPRTSALHRSIDHDIQALS